MPVSVRAWEAAALFPQGPSASRGSPARDAHRPWTGPGRARGGGGGGGGGGTRDPRPRETDPRRLAHARAPPPPPLPSSAQRVGERRPDANPGQPRVVQLGGSWPAGRALLVRRGPAKEALGGRGAPQPAAATEGARDNELGSCALRPPLAGLSGSTCEHGPDAPARCPAALRPDRAPRLRRAAAGAAGTFFY